MGGSGYVGCVCRRRMKAGSGGRRAVGEEERGRVETGEDERRGA